jgi:hypothetical protein
LKPNQQQAHPCSSRRRLQSCCCCELAAPMCGEVAEDSVHAHSFSKDITATPIVGRRATPISFVWFMRHITKQQRATCTKASHQQAISRQMCSTWSSCNISHSQRMTCAAKT